MKKIVYWVPVVLIAGLIFWFSSQPYQNQDVKPLLNDYINEEWVEESLSWIQFDYAGYFVSVASLGAASFIEFLIRKGAHFGIFFLLGFFTCRALFATILHNRKSTCFVSSILFIILFAVQDELHQHFTGDRTPLIHDVMIDSVGGLAGILLSLVIISRFGKK